MSTDKDTGTGSVRVRSAYRELAAEKTPRALDDAVLQLARSAAVDQKRSRSRLAAWTRPLAWAATIGLCLAIVLEVNRQTPGVSDVNFHEAETPLLRERLEDAASDAMPQQEQRKSQTDSPAVSSDQAEIDVGASRSREALQQLSPVTVESKNRVDSFAAPGAPVLPAPESDAAKTESVAAPAAALMRRMQVDENSACSAEVRAAAERWLACIEQLRRSGDSDRADNEYARFLQSFPDHDDAIAPE